MPQRPFDERRPTDVARADDEDTGPFPCCHRIPSRSAGSWAGPHPGTWTVGDSQTRVEQRRSAVVLVPLRLEHRNDNDRPLAHDINNALQER